MIKKYALSILLVLVPCATIVPAQNGTDDTTHSLISTALWSSVLVGGSYYLYKKYCAPKQSTIDYTLATPLLHKPTKPTLSQMAEIMALDPKDIRFINAATFTTMLEEYAVCAAAQIASSALWHDNNALPAYFFNLAKERPFAPYAQKLLIPCKSTVAFFGDLHGCAHSLLRSLERLKKAGHINDEFEIVDPRFYMVFLGDYVDRGYNGVEVLYILMRLKAANPDRVFLVRGNHEDATINESPSCGGFTRELHQKFGPNTNAEAMVYRLYDLLPVVLYVGFERNGTANYFQCCHGGMEMGFNPQPLLSMHSTRLASGARIACQMLGTLDRHTAFASIAGGNGIKTALHSVTQSIRDHNRSCWHVCDHRTMKPENIGFMWNDFIVDEGQEIVRYHNGRGWEYGKSLTQEALRQASSDEHRVVGVIRAHQSHGEMLQRLCATGGLVGLWQNPHYTGKSCVYTTFSAPIYPGFNVDAFAMLTVNQAGDWAISLTSHDIEDPRKI